MYLQDNIIIQYRNQQVLIHPVLNRLILRLPNQSQYLGQQYPQRSISMGDKASWTCQEKYHQQLVLMDRYKTVQLNCHLFKKQYLPPASVVRGKVMFSVCSLGGGIPLTSSPRSFPRFGGCTPASGPRPFLGGGYLLVLSLVLSQVLLWRGDPRTGERVMPRRGR